VEPSKPDLTSKEEDEEVEEEELNTMDRCSTTGLISAFQELWYSS